ncbi:HAD hydrolase family protein [Roseobacter sp. HKCCD7870]|uniref:HAD hydrolase family protein n=1 Tax=Roseobacter sp. HKCCD7870 TaxID=3120343 RepID=UPI0030EC8BA0
MKNLISDNSSIKDTNKTIVIDLDGTLTIESNAPYHEKIPNRQVIEVCRKYHDIGYKIVIFTARNMRTHKGDIETILADTYPIIIEWLKKNNVPYDEVVVGKPWCGEDGFYVDDKAIRPNEFVSSSVEEIKRIIQGKSK